MTRSCVISQTFSGVSRHCVLSLCNLPLFCFVCTACTDAVYAYGFVLLLLLLFCGFWYMITAWIVLMRGVSS